MSMIRLENENSLSFGTAMGTLKSFDLVHQGKSPGAFEMHELIQDCLQSWLKKNRMLKQYTNTALEVVSRCFPPDLSFESWGAWDSILPHAETAYTSLCRLSLTPRSREATFSYRWRVMGSREVLLKLNRQGPKKLVEFARGLVATSIPIP